jgi:hypothetical protein
MNIQVAHTDSPNVTDLGMEILTIRRPSDASKQFGVCTSARLMRN